MNQQQDVKAKKVNAYLKYSGLAFQLAFLVAACLFIGGFIDKYFDLKVPIATIGLILVFFSGYMFKLYKELTKR